MPGTKESGRRKVPTTKLANRGSRWAGDRPNEAKTENAIPDPPKNLKGYALDLWHEKSVQLFNLGLMAVVDRETLGQYCLLCGLLWKLAEKEDVNQIVKLRGEIRRLEGMFGLSPSDRAGIPVKKPEKKDKFLKLAKKA